MAIQCPATACELRLNAVANTCTAAQCSRKQVIPRKHKVIGTTTSLQDVNTSESQAIIECTFVSTVEAPKVFSIRSHQSVYGSSVVHTLAADGLYEQVNIPTSINLKPIVKVAAHQGGHISERNRRCTAVPIGQAATTSLTNYPLAGDIGGS